jgi:protocadherin-16/23
MAPSKARNPDDNIIPKTPFSFQVEASDLDCGLNSVVHYSIKETLAADAFHVDGDTGRICIAKSLDHERQSSYDFTVVASDRGGLSTSTMVKVQITDINDNEPEFKPAEYRAKIRSRFPVAGKILTVAAYDADSGPAGDVRYRIQRGDGGQFAIDPEAGVISLKSALPSSSGSFELLIGATDGQGRRSKIEARVVIDVDDDDLTFNKPQYSFQIDEDVSPYSNVGRIEAKTSGADSQTLEIYSSNVDNYISIDARSGVLRTEARLDHETNPKVLLNVRMVDTATGLESYCQVVIDIKDQNDNAPEFGHPMGMASVPEDFPVGDTIYVSKAEDADSGPNGEVTYRLAQNSGGGLFNLNDLTGELVLAKKLDYEQSHDHVVMIEASDKGYPSLKSTLRLQIYVHDKNDNSPQFEQSEYSVNLSESHPINTPIATLKAKDADGGRNGRVTYTMSDNQYVSVLQNSGVLVLKRPLDREAKKSLEVQVTAKDHGVPPLQSSAVVRLFISDRNDNSPRFDSDAYAFSTVENLPYGTYIGTVKAADQDEGENGHVEYDFRTPVDSFVINKVTGRISTGRILDREEHGEHELLVEAVDKGRPRRSSQTVVKITVDDLNDNAPRLVEPASKMIYVKKGTPVGSAVARLAAEDPDEQGSGKVAYKVLDSNPLVSVSSDGEVRLVRRLPSSGGPSFSVRLQLSDGGQPVMTAKEELTIVVVGEEDGHQMVPLSRDAIHQFLRIILKSDS